MDKIETRQKYLKLAGKKTNKRNENITSQQCDQTERNSRCANNETKHTRIRFPYRNWTCQALAGCTEWPRYVWSPRRTHQVSKHETELLLRTGDHSSTDRQPYQRPHKALARCVN